MKRYFVILFSLALALSTIPQAPAAVRADLTQATVGIKITENWIFRSPPVIYGIQGDGWTGPFVICKDIEDVACTSAAQISAVSQLPPCDSQIVTNCIATIYALDIDGLRTEGTFVKFATGVSQWDFAARPQNNLPQGRGQGGIWKIPGITHSGGNDLYYASTFLDSSAQKTSGSVITTEKFNVNRMESAIIPVNEIAGVSGYAIPLDSSNPSNDGSANGGVGNGIVGTDRDVDQLACITVGGGVCQSARDFPKDYRFGMKIILGEKIKGWFHGRIYQPVIEIDSTNNQQVITFEALPVQVPTVEELVPTSQIQGEFRSYLEGDRSFSTSGSYLMPGSSGTEAIELAGFWLPVIKDRATTSRTYWTVRSLSEQQQDSVYRCSSGDTNLAGIVTTNSLVYSAGPPTYNRDEGSLDYKLLSPHLTASGEVAIGSYDLVLRSDVARCIYGFTNAPIQATISIVSRDGENKVATTLIREKNNWLTLSAQGFTFSSPTIRVKLSQEAPPAPEPTATPAVSIKPVPKKSSITCTKGKVVKKVSAIKPKCPNGFKKK